MAMGKWEASDTGIPGTGVEAVGDEEKMSKTRMPTAEAMDHILFKLHEYELDKKHDPFLSLAYSTLEAEIEIRAAAQSRLDELEKFVKHVADYCNDSSICRRAFDLLEQTSDSNRPHHENGTGAKSET
jgi:hypothetical protein